MYSAIEIANYILWKGTQAPENDLSHLKLQKLLYYTQGFSLVISGAPCFREEVVAWEHGPVVCEVYSKYNRTKGRVLKPDEGFTPESLDLETRKLIDEVFETYGQFSAWRLREMTHEESPWKSTVRSQPITHDKMRDFFVNFVCE